MRDIGTAAPDVTFIDEAGNPVKTSDFAGHWVVLWWYPEANTPGCTLQAASIERHLAEIEADGTVILGASFDAPEKNNPFACERTVPLRLLSDVNREAGEAYDVLRDPDDPGYHRSKRCTFYIDPAGRIAHAEDATSLDLTHYGPHVLSTLAQLKSDASAATITVG